MTKRRSQNAVSLFPFLAVLVCTMGALILLLLVTTRRIRQKQEEVAAVAEEVATKDTSSLDRISREQLTAAEHRLDAARLHHEEAEDQLLKLQQQRDLILQERDSLQNELDDLQAAFNAREAREEIQTIEILDQEQHLLACQTACDTAEEDVEKARRAVRRAESELADAEGAALHTEMLVAQQLSAIERLRDQRRSNQQRVADVGTTETLIEFSGPRGTARTPIVVDVDADGFLFSTSGVRVRRQDLAGFSVHDNPLLAAVLTTHRYRSNDSVVTRPYVLLLIRPGGILDFYPAQRVLNDARIHFGYELLSEDEQIAVAEPADGETEAVRMAVLDVLSRRNQHLAGASDIRQRIAALRAKEAVRQRQHGQTPRNAQQGPASDESGAEWVEAPVVRPFPDSRSRDAGDEPNAIASNSRSESTDAWRPREASDRAHPAQRQRQERRSIQQLLNPGMEIERSLAAAVEAHQRAKRPAHGQSRGYEPLRRNAADGPDASFPDRRLAQQPLESSEGTEDWASGESAEERFWNNIEQQKRVSESLAKGHPTSTRSGSQHSAPDNQPPLEGQPFQSADTAQQPKSGATGQVAGGQPGNPSGHLAGGDVSPSAELNLTYYEPVTVYLDPQYLTVAGDDPVPLHGAPVSAILEALLTDIDKATQKGPELSFVRRLPVVNFVVSPGAHTLYLQVAEGLHDRGIPASSVVSLESYVEEHSNETGAALRSLDPNTERNQRRPQTTPISEYRELP